MALALVGACGGETSATTSTESVTSTEPSATTSTTTESTSTSIAVTTTTTNPQETQGSGLTFEPCDLLTSAEVEAYLGTPVNDGERQTMDTNDVKDCVWLDPETFNSVVIQGFAHDSVDPEVFNTDEDIGLSATLIDGKGERAMQLSGYTIGGEESDEAVNSIWALKGGNTIAVYAWNTIADTPRYQDFLGLVDLAITRMP